MGEKNLLVFGASGHAKVVIDIIEKQNQYNIIGIVDATLPKGNLFFGYEILGKDEDFPLLLKSTKVLHCVVAIGDNWIRQKVVQKIESYAANIQFITAIHPSAVIGKSVQLGRGTVVMAGAIINPDTLVGDFAIINTAASLDHDCRLGDFSSLAPHVSVGGGSTIGNGSAVSIGATVLHNITIGNQSIVGAGALVNKNVPGNTVVYGVPARAIRKRVAGEKYL